MTVARAFALIDYLARQSPEGVKVVEICDVLGMHRVSVHRLIRTLVKLGYVEQDSDRLYHLGVEAWSLGLAAHRRFDLAAAAEHALDRVAEESRDTVFLMRRVGNYAVCVARREGSYPVQLLVMNVGSRRPLGIGASSLSILAHLEAREIEEVTRQNAAAYAGFGVDDPERIRRLVADARRRGYAYSPALVVPDAHAIAVPIFDNRNCPVAALSIATIKSRMMQPRRDELVRLIRTEADAITRGLYRRNDGR